ncbi:MAG: hypothetical protein ACR2GO_00035 [Candidatus Limnocylindria bacterium]
MSDRVPPIARIRLSRFLPRLLVLPILGLLAGAAAIAAGVILVPGVAGLPIAGLGAVAMVAAVVGAVVLLSIRLDVEEAAVRIAWLGGERVYPLSAGPVTRVRLRGENASRLRARGLGIGWQLGAAMLRDEEEIDVVRLARTPTAILVPTERGRLAIAAADEESLLNALSRAARARQRLDELTRDVLPVVPVQQPAPAVIDPALMTGIERALSERRLAEEREAAANVLAAQQAAPVEAPAAVLPAPREAEPVEARANGRQFRLPRPTWRLRLTSSLALLALPLVGAGVAWGAAVLLNRMPQPGTDLGRLTTLALVLAGPATTVGAILARVWWPRLVSVVVAGGLVTAVFVGRALLG